MIQQSKTVFVLGAGFTKAFLPDAPLLVDNYNLDPLLEKYKHFDIAFRLLKQERDRYKQRINIERLLTRLDGMPFDRDDASFQFGQLKQDVHNLFVDRLGQAKAKGDHLEDLGRFARYCVEKGIKCITFNYDDVLDKALWEVKKLLDGKPYWHPNGGYGVFLRPSDSTIGDTPWASLRNTSMLLLKLHGSINWRVKLGFSKPYSLDAIVHHSRWGSEQYNAEPVEHAIESHLTNEMFIVPPVLAKSSLEEPILQQIWGKAYLALHDADEVVFVGYSCPITDLAVNFLFSEAIFFERPRVTVVNKVESERDQERLKAAYRNAFPNIQDSQFQFRDALEWARELVADDHQATLG